MGMFDEIFYEREMYQTKDTPQQSLDTYEIRGDELWWKKTEYEWEDDKDSMFGGYMQEVSHEWVFCDRFDGVIDFYRENKEEGNKWIEYHTLFNNGRMIKIERKE
jgi:hypothetical protein